MHGARCGPLGSSSNATRLQSLLASHVAAIVSSPAKVASDRQLATIASAATEVWLLPSFVRTSTRIVKLHATEPEPAPPAGMHTIQSLFVRSGLEA